MLRKINQDNPVSRMLGGLTDLMILNVLFVVTCIPIVTIGAGISALYSVTLKMAKGEESYIAREYFRAFKGNFRQATIVWSVTLGLLVVFYENFHMMNAGALSGSAKDVTQVLLTVSAVFLVLILLWFFPLIARFENTLKQTLVNALVMAVRHFGYTLLLLAITIIPIAVTVFSGSGVVYGIPFWLFFGFALVSIANAGLFRRVFARYE